MLLRVLKLCFLILIGTLGSFISHAQGPTSHWYFGYGSGMRFQNGVPSHISNSALSYAPEGTAVHSNEAGDLLFYGNPELCYDSIHQVLQNGAGLAGGFSSTQGALIIPNPLDTNVFYYISQGGTSHRYSIIRHTAAFPQGEILASEKNLFLANGTTEKTTAVHHANGKDIWIITRLYQADSILAFLVDENGINTTPIYSPVPHTEYGYQGQMKSSPDGRYLSDCGVVGSWQYHIQAFVHRFDNETGLVTETVAISDSSLATYGTEFSANSEQLYFTTLGGNGLYQYSVDTFDSASIIASKYVHNVPALFALQIGLDHKIYGTRTFLSHLSRIENPNEYGSNVNINQNAVFLNGDTAGLGLPDFIQSYFHPAYFDYTSSCNEPVYFSANTTGVDSLRWDFGDSLNSINTSTISPVYHSYLTQGYHTVRLSVYIGGVEYTFKRLVYARSGVLGGNRDSVSYCADSILISNLSEIPFASYSWNNGDTTSSKWVSEEGDYYVTVSGQCDTIRDTIVVYLPVINAVNLGNDTSICRENSFSKSAFQPNASYLWSSGDTTPTIIIDTAGVYIVTVFGLCDSVSDTIVVTMSPVFTSIILSQQQNGGVLLTAGVGSNYQWNTGDTSQSITATNHGTYSVTYLDDDGCMYEAEIVLDEDDFVGIESKVDAMGFRVYPNPTKSSLFIECDHAGVYSIDISDVTGQIIQSDFIECGGVRQIELNQIENGVYFISLKNGESGTIRKIVVQK